MSEDFSCDAVVVGAGVVGLATARALAQAGRETIILEKNAQFGMETSSRNSEVIHASLYYPKDSLKARMCVAGKHRLYAFCERHGVPFKRLGKLIVAVQPDQDAQLESLLANARGNGVDDLTRLSKTEIAAREPALQAIDALFSPSTGIIDSHHYMLALLGDCEQAGAQLARKARVMAIARKGGKYHLTVCSDGEDMHLSCSILINSAGLWAWAVAGMIDGLDAAFIPPRFLAKGSYVTLVGKNPFQHLVYPLPEPGGLGVHLTLDIGGGARFGPNVEWLNTKDPAAINYAVASDTPHTFAPRIAAYWPTVVESMLMPGYAGVRPKLTGQGQPNADFRTDGPAVHGMAGLVNLFGIESPGITASLATADHVRGLLDG
jgi:L-2-hydroxyglutarate oxidase LhgO